METLFWICFLIGVIYSIVIVVFGDVLAGAFDASLEWLQLDNLPFFQPMTIMSGLTIFGGSGIVLLNFFPFSMLVVVACSFVITVIGVVLLYFLYIKPMSNTENSISFSIFDLVGKKADVLVPIPAAGYGEVMIKTIGGMTNHTAASFDGIDIRAEASVVVVEVKDGVLIVSEIQL